MDDEWRADVGYGGAFETELEPGEHEVKVTNRLKTERMTLVLREGETATFQAANVLSKGLSSLVGAFGVVVYHVTLRRVG